MAVLQLPDLRLKNVPSTATSRISKETRNEVAKNSRGRCRRAAWAFVRCGFDGAARMNPINRFVFRLLWPALLLLAVMGTGRVLAAGAVTSVSRTGDRLDIGLGRDTLTVRVRTADMIEVDYRPNGKSTPQTPCIDEDGVGARGGEVPTDTDPIVISTSAMTVTIRRSPCRIAVYDKAGRLLVKEQDAQGVSPGGLKLTGADGSHFFGIHGWEYLDKAGSQGELAPRSKPYTIRRGRGGQYRRGRSCGAAGATASMWTPPGASARSAARTASSFPACPGRMSDTTSWSAMPTRLHTLLDNSPGCRRCSRSGRWGCSTASSPGSPSRTFAASWTATGRAASRSTITSSTSTGRTGAATTTASGSGTRSSSPMGPSGRLKRDMDARGIKMVGIMKPRIHRDTVQGQLCDPGRVLGQEAVLHRLFRPRAGGRPGLLPPGLPAMVLGPFDRCVRHRHRRLVERRSRCLGRQPRVPVHGAGRVRRPAPVHARLEARLHHQPQLLFRLAALCLCDMVRRH